MTDRFNQPDYHHHESVQPATTYIVMVEPLQAHILFLGKTLGRMSQCHGRPLGNLELSIRGATFWSHCRLLRSKRRVQLRSVKKTIMLRSKSSCRSLLAVETRRERVMLLLRRWQSSNNSKGVRIVSILG